MDTTTHVLSEEEVICLEECGSYEEYAHTRSLFEKNVCPYCWAVERGDEQKIHTILFENLYWIVWDNPHKHDLHCEAMLSIVLKPHVYSLMHMNAKHWILFEEIMVFIARKFDVKLGILSMRLGDMQFHEGTLPHLHFNLLVPDKSGEVHIPVFGCNSRSREENRERAARYSTRFETRHEI